MTEKKCEKCVYFQEHSQVNEDVICGLYGFVFEVLCDLLNDQNKQIKELQQLIEDMSEYIEKLGGWEENV